MELVHFWQGGISFDHSSIPSDRSFSIPTPSSHPKLHLYKHARPSNHIFFLCLPASSRRSTSRLHTFQPSSRQSCHLQFKMFGTVKLVLFTVAVAVGVQAQSSTPTPTGSPVPTSVPGISPCALSCVQQSLSAGGCTSMFVIFPHLPPPV